MRRGVYCVYVPKVGSSNPVQEFTCETQIHCEFGPTWAWEGISVEMVNWTVNEREDELDGSLEVPCSLRESVID